MAMTFKVWSGPDVHAPMEYGLRPGAQRPAVQSVTPPARPITSDPAPRLTVVVRARGRSPAGRLCSGRSLLLKGYPGRGTGVARPERGHRPECRGVDRGPGAGIPRRSARLCGALPVPREHQTTGSEAPRI